MNLSKKQKFRACDQCRKKKSKCDAKSTDSVCSSCLQSNKPCTYLEDSKPRGPPKAYVTGLEDRLEKLEALLKRLRPDQDFSAELGPSVIRGSWKDPPSAPHRSSSPSPTSSRRSSHLLILPSSPTTNTLNVQTHLLRSHKSSVSDKSSDSPYSSDPDDLVDDKEKGMHQLTLRKASHLHSEESKEEQHERFHGQSSSLPLIDATRRYKQQHLIESGDPETLVTHSLPSSRVPNPIRRPEYWQAPRWELVWEGLHVDSPEMLTSVLEAFPPQDLAAELIRLYFRHVNSQFPLLHRPTFEKQWHEKLHEKNIWFACVTACLFSVASRWCDDPRVLPKGARTDSGGLDWTLAGWDFFKIGIGVHRARRSLLYPATLFEIQTFTLLAMFLRGTHNHTVGWLFVTIGIRKAQDVGAHRKTVYKRTPTVDEELWKRAFWLLVAFDRFGSASLGRSCGVAEEDFDLELPLEIDDEYWETDDPLTSFKQPPDVPCKVTAFNLWIKLTQIMAFALRTLYPHSTSKSVYGRIPIPDTREIVRQLEVALAEWTESVPEYLKWSNQIEDPIFANQSATLYTNYYLTQILVYRQFLRPRMPATNLQPSPFPALVLCSNAAKSCARIIETQMERKLSNVPNLIHVSNISAAILIMHLWDLKGKEKAQIVNPAEDIKPQYAMPIQILKEEIALLIRALEWAAPRFPIVSRILAHLRQSLDDEATAQNITFDNQNSSWPSNHITISDPSFSNPPSRWDTTSVHPNLQPQPVREVDPHYGPNVSHLRQTNWSLAQPTLANGHDVAFSSSQPPPFISMGHRTPSFTDSSISTRYESSSMDFPSDLDRYWEDRGVSHHVPTSHARSSTTATFDKQFSGNWDEYHRNTAHLPSHWSEENFARHNTHRTHPAGASAYR